MKKSILSILAFCTFLYSFAGLLDQNMNYSIFRISAKYNDAVAADYKEYPGSTTSDSSFIWGNFNTRFIGAELDARIFAMIIINAGYTYGTILGNRMYINSLDNYLTIGGASNGGYANVCIRTIDGMNGYLDIYTGFMYTSAEKKFSDFTSSGTVLNPGEFGSYKINMFGPNFGLRGDWVISSFMGIGGKIEGSPYYENNTVVSGWTAEPIEEYAKGYRYAAEFSVDFKFLLFDLKAGARSEKIHFNSGENATHDLDITYIGPFANVGFSI